MCIDEDYCPGRRLHDQLRWQSTLSPVDGLAVTQQAMTQVQALTGWDSASFVSAQWMLQSVHVQLRGESAGRDVAKLLLPQSPCVESYLHGDRHWTTWRGTFAETAMLISTSWPATPTVDQTAGLRLQRQPSRRQSYGPRRG
ncbi:hypothetical protein Kisp01_50140 [Kineosporia sp. NBRC 101677]|nr:hypothetical protein Kisp01_50140 [Kineosporia sp. NBRC 101677]